VKIQNMSGKVCLMCKRKTLLGIVQTFYFQNIAAFCQKTFENKKFVDNAQQCFAFTPQATFPSIL
jgi:hypothetical protein